MVVARAAWLLDWHVRYDEIVFHLPDQLGSTAIDCCPLLLRHPGFDLLDCTDHSVILWAAIYEYNW